jgi:hypothetical protein
MSLKHSLKQCLTVCLVTMGLLFGESSRAGANDGRWHNGVPDYKEAPITIRQDGPKLVFSDSPEMVGQCGVMYRDTVNGKVRLFFHHVNDTNSGKRLAVVLRRTTIWPPRVQLGSYGISHPNRDWLEAGKEAQQKYYRSAKDNGSFMVTSLTDLIGREAPTIIKPKQLVTGIVNLETDHPVEVSIMMIPIKTDLRLALEAYSILPPDQGGHVLRGTFPTSDCHITMNEIFSSNKFETWGIKLADDVNNPYVRGIDATTGKEVVNYGNYGVMYDVTLPVKGKRDTILRFNPYGGPYAGAGLIKVDGEPEQMIDIPQHRLAFGWNHDAETMVLAEIPADKSAVFHFSPPGSSNLPIRLFLTAKIK